MKIIPMMVVLICASGSRPWKASALELRIPLLGRMKLEFQTDTTSETPVDDPVMDRSSEKVSEVEPKEDDGDQATKPTLAIDKNEPTETSTKATTLAKDDKQTTQKMDKESPTTAAVKDKSTKAPGKATSTAATATDKNGSTEASTEATEVKVTTLAKDDKQTTQKIDKGPSKTTPVKEQPTEAPAEASSTAAEATTVAKSKPTNKATEATTTKPKQTTAKATVTEEPKESQAAGSDPDDFDDSDIWDDTEEPPKEFGREYDLRPDLLDSGGNDLGDFQPKLQLPPNMTNDMFFESPAKEQSNDKEDDEDTEGGGFFERIKHFFSIENIKEELDTIPGKMQALMDRFRQKKSDGLKKLREQMDDSAEKVGQKIAEAFAKLKAAKKSPQQCVPEIRESFKQYEAALQDGIKPCMDKVESMTSKQEGALRNAQAKSTQMLTDMQGCVSKLDSSGLNSFVKSILNMGSCTKKSIQSKIEASLEPQMKRLSEMVQQQGSKLNGNMNATGRCVERQLQLPQFQKLQQELVAKGKQCLERND